jgi:hypothetical protein
MWTSGTVLWNHRGRSLLQTARLHRRRRDRALEKAKPRMQSRWCHRAARSRSRPRPRPPPPHGASCSSAQRARLPGTAPAGPLFSRRRSGRRSLLPPPPARSAPHGIRTPKAWRSAVSPGRRGRSPTVFSGNRFRSLQGSVLRTHPKGRRALSCWTSRERAPDRGGIR